MFGFKRVLKPMNICVWCILALDSYWFTSPRVGLGLIPCGVSDVMVPGSRRVDVANTRLVQASARSKRQRTQ